MPINVFGNSSNTSDNKIDTSLFVQKPYLRTNYIEANIEEDINLKNQYKIKNLPDPTNLQDACNKNYVDNKFNDPSILKNTAHIDLNDRNITNARFIQVNQLPQIDGHLTAKLYVDNSIDEASLLRLDPNEILDLNNQDSILLNSTLNNLKTIIELPTKAYIDGLHDQNERSRRNLGIDFYDESDNLVKNNQDNNFNDNIILNLKSIQINDAPINEDHAVNKKYIDDNFLTNADTSLVRNNQSNNFNNNIISNIQSIEINNDPTNNKHGINKKYLDDKLDNDTIIRLNDNSHNEYLKVQINNNFYNLQIHNKIQITDVTKILFPNTGHDLLPKWRIVCNNRFNSSIPTDFIKSTITNSPTGQSGATVIPPIGNAFMYIETSGNNHNDVEDNVFVSIERTDIINISNISFYYNRFSISQALKRNMGKFEISILIANKVWNTIYTLEKNTNFSTLSTDWIILNLNIANQPNYGIKLVYSGINTAHADMCFSDISITHSYN